MLAIQCTGSADFFSPCLFSKSVSVGDEGKHNRHLPSYCYPNHTLWLIVKVGMAKGGLMSHVAGW